MKRRRVCLMCGREMRRLRWYEWITEPPPMHDMSRDPECQRLYRERLGLR